MLKFEMSTPPLGPVLAMSMLTTHAGSKRKKKCKACQLAKDGDVQRLQEKEDAARLHGMELQDSEVQCMNSITQCLAIELPLAWMVVCE